MLCSTFSSLSHRTQLTSHTHNTTKVLRYQQKSNRILFTGPPIQRRHNKFHTNLFESFRFRPKWICTCIWYARFILGIEKFRVTFLHSLQIKKKNQIFRARLSTRQTIGMKLAAISASHQLHTVRRISYAHSNGIALKHIFLQLNCFYYFSSKWKKEKRKE